MAEVKLNFSANTATAVKGIQSVNGAIASAKTGFKSMLASITPIGLALGALGASLLSLKGIKDVIDLGGDLDDLSSKTGIAVKDLVILQEAFRLAGMEGADVGKIVNGLSAKLDMPTPKILETLKVLGLELEYIQSLPIGERFQVIGEAIGRLTSETERANAAQTLFGKTAGNNLLVVFNNARAFDEARASVGGLADTMNKHAADLAAIGDGFDSIKNKALQFYAALLGPNVDKLKEIAMMITNIDLTSAGNAVGLFIQEASAVIENLISGLNNGKFGEVLSNELELAWLNVEPLIISIFDKAADIFLKSLGGDFALNFKTGMRELLNPGSESTGNYYFAKGQLIGMDELPDADAQRREERKTFLRSQRGTLGNGTVANDGFRNDAMGTMDYINGIMKDLGTTVKTVIPTFDIMQETLKLGMANIKDSIAQAKAKLRPGEEGEYSALPDIAFSSMRAIGGESGYKNFDLTAQNPLLNVAQQNLALQKEIAGYNKELVELMKNNTPNQSSIQQYYAIAG